MPLFPSESLPDLQTLNAFIGKLADLADPIYHDVFVLTYDTSQPVHKIIALTAADIDTNGSIRVNRGQDKISEHQILLDPRSLDIIKRRSANTCQGILFPSPVNPCKHISRATIGNAWTAARRALNIKSNAKADPLTESQAQQFRQHLEQHHPQIYLDIWDIQMDTQQRISDVLPMNINSIKKNDKYWVFKTVKNARAQRIPIKDRARQVITRRLRAAHASEHKLLFPSPVKPEQPISTRAVGAKFKNIGEDLGLEATCGTHTPRKTGAYLLHKRGTDLAVIMKLLGHSNVETTMHYLGISDADVAAARTQISAMIR